MRSSAAIASGAALRGQGRGARGHVRAGPARVASPRVGVRRRRAARPPAPPRWHRVQLARRARPGERGDQLGHDRRSLLGQVDVGPAPPQPAEGVQRGARGVGGGRRGERIGEQGRAPPHRRSRAGPARRSPRRRRGGAARGAASSSTASWRRRSGDTRRAPRRVWACHPDTTWAASGRSAGVDVDDREGAAARRGASAVCATGNTRARDTDAASTGRGDAATRAPCRAIERAAGRRRSRRRLHRDRGRGPGRRSCAGARPAPRRTAPWWRSPPRRRRPPRRSRPAPRTRGARRRRSAPAGASPPPATRPGATGAPTPRGPAGATGRRRRPTSRATTSRRRGSRGPAWSTRARWGESRFPTIVQAMPAIRSGLGHAVHLGADVAAEQPSVGLRSGLPLVHHAVHRLGDRAGRRRARWASSITTFDVFTPSATMLISAMISSMLAPLAELLADVAVAALRWRCRWR